MKVEAIKKTVWGDSPPITTVALEYPRFIHCELMTHRMLSKNSASSRAIPVKSTIKMVRDNPADIVYWGKAMSGMQAREELSGWRLSLAKAGWVVAREACILFAKLFGAVKLHKQIANRILEPFYNISVLVTATEWDNFFALRTHESAQPEFQTLSRMIQDEIAKTPAVECKYHIPFVDSVVSSDGLYLHFPKGRGFDVNLNDALKISSSICAQWSYRKFDPSMDKADKIWSQLVESKPVHASPTEHQAWAMENAYAVDEDGFNPENWEAGVTHMDKQCRYWSGNIRGWIQHRQTINGNVVNGMIEDV